MKIDVLIEYNEKLSEVTFSSKATQFTQTRPARIGLSRPKDKDLTFELIEFVGEDWEVIKNVQDWFEKEPSRKNHVLRVINPFESSTFEPVPAFRMINHLLMVVQADIYPKTWSWRRIIPFFDKYEITLKIPGYNFFNPQKKSEFEELLHTEYKNVSFVS